jgi:hypothetical protein
MDIEITNKSIKLSPDSVNSRLAVLEWVFIEEVLKLKKDGDFVKLVRRKKCIETEEYNPIKDKDFNKDLWDDVTGDRV